MRSKPGARLPGSGVSTRKAASRRYWKRSSPASCAQPVDLGILKTRAPIPAIILPTPPLPLRREARPEPPRRKRKQSSGAGAIFAAFLGLLVLVGAITLVVKGKEWFGGNTPTTSPPTDSTKLKRSPMQPRPPRRPRPPLTRPKRKPGMPRQPGIRPRKRPRMLKRSRFGRKPPWMQGQPTRRQIKAVADAQTNYTRAVKALDELRTASAKMDKDKGFVDPGPPKMDKDKDVKK